MIFYGIDNQIVDFRITNYEFLESSDEYDKNWLLIYLQVKSKLGNWQTTDPSLLTWEVGELIDWFNTLLQNRQPNYINLNFTEPNLSLELLENVSETAKFRIKFDSESKPQSAKENNEYYVDCLADNLELKRIVNELEKELEKFPQR